MPPHAFILDDQERLVRRDEPRPQLFVAAITSITGEVRRFQRGLLERELRIPLQRSAGRPVIVVELLAVVA